MQFIKTTASQTDLTAFLGLRTYSFNLSLTADWLHISNLNGKQAWDDGHSNRWEHSVDWWGRYSGPDTPRLLWWHVNNIVTEYFCRWLQLLFPLTYFSTNCPSSYSTLLLKFPIKITAFSVTPNVQVHGQLCHQTMLSHTRWLDSRLLLMTC